MERPRRIPFRSLPENAQVWTVSLSLCAFAGVLWYTLVRHGEELSGDVTMPWWVVGLAVLLAETRVVHLHFRSESGSFSFLELPMVLGLLFADPTYVVPAASAGMFIALALIRRQSPVKVAFNVGNFSLRFTAAYILLRWMVQGIDPLEPLGWVAVAGAIISTSALEVLMIAVIITIAEGNFRGTAVRKMLLFGVLVAVANTVQALIMGLLILYEPWGLVLLGFSTAVLFVAYRAYVAERAQRARIEFLYSSAKALSADQHDLAAANLLQNAAATFRSGRAELHVMSVDELGEGTITAWTEEGASLAPMTPADRIEVNRLANEADPPILVDVTHAAAMSYVTRRGLGDAMVGRLGLGPGRAGILLVADRLGDVSTFEEEDLQAFATLVQQASFGLENDQLARAVTELRSTEAKLEHEASHDPLTGLANRSRFKHRLRSQLDEGHTVALLYVDLDNFKVVNDTLGHAAGDRVLQETSLRLLSAIRPTDVAARLGGDEFAVMLVDHTEPAIAAEHILELVSQPIDISGEAAVIGASVGLAESAHGDSPEVILQHADTAMYAAKAEGKGSLVIYEPHMDDQVSAQSQLRVQLRHAVQGDEFSVLYQPIVDLASETVVGAEALVRWSSPDGLRLPQGFLTEAERSGLIVPIDSYVFRQVVHDVGRLQEQFGEDIWVGSNVSSKTLQDPNLVDRVGEALAAAGTNPASVVLEVTEAALMRDPDLAHAQLERLQAMGLRIALDDFGTGFSSLTTLRRMPIDILKVAQSFVDDLVGDDEAYVRAMVQLGHSLNMRVLAEGIESKSAMISLRLMGCELGQGYHFAAPLPLEDLAASVRAARVRWSGVSEN